MARINADQADSMSTNNSGGWLKLADDGDCASVQFFAGTVDDIEMFSVHRVKEEGSKFDRNVNCLRNYNDPINVCPLCAAGLKPEAAIMLSMVDVDEKEVKIWQRGRGFLKTLHGFFSRYEPVNETVVDIERSGAKGDLKTTYGLYENRKKEPVDLSKYEKPEFLGTIILDLKPAEMDTFLNTGKLPGKDDDSDEAPRTRRRSEEPAPTNRVSRRRGG